MNINRIDFKNYCLRKLGAPVMAINVEANQIEDRIDDALQKFWEFHGDGTIREYLTYVITPQDRASKSIQVPDWVLSILRVVSFGSPMSPISFEYQAFIQSMFSGGMTMYDRLTSYTISLTYLSLINDMFTRSKLLRYNYKYGKVFIDTAWDTIADGDVIVFECYKITNPDDMPRVWNDPWLKAYATALIKLQWGQNMIKYDGFTLPSGITLNGRNIFEDAKEEIASLEEELNTTYSLPIDFFTG